MTPPEPETTDEATGDQRRPAGDVVYREQPRSYVETLIVVVVIAAGFAVDAGLSVSGALTHLPGWLIALALIAGLDAVFVASARATRRLVVTTDEVWVGDEMIMRADVEGVTPPETRDMPVLGWPGGKPGRFKGVAVRLDDGRDVLVPSRRPARLAAALGASAPAPRAPLVIRDATEDDLAALSEIDARAEIVFGLSGIELPAIEWSPPPDAVITLVAGDPPVAFAVVVEVDGAAHLDEIAVLPSAMRTGLGTRLLDEVAARAAEAGYEAITLTTFADVPWNAPWYRDRGFVELADCTPGLAGRRERERALGLDEAGRRVAMRRDLSGEPGQSPAA